MGFRELSLSEREGIKGAWRAGESVDQCSVTGTDPLLPPTAPRLCFSLSRQLSTPTLIYWL